MASAVALRLVTQAGVSGDAALDDYQNLPHTPQRHAHEGQRRQKHRGPAHQGPPGALVDLRVLGVVSHAEQLHHDQKAQRVQQGAELDPLPLGQAIHIDFTVQPVEVLAESTAS